MKKKQTHFGLVEVQKAYEDYLLQLIIYHTMNGNNEKANKIKESLRDILIMRHKI